MRVFFYVSSLGSQVPGVGIGLGVCRVSMCVRGSNFQHSWTGISGETTPGAVPGLTGTPAGGSYCVSDWIDVEQAHRPWFSSRNGRRRVRLKTTRPVAVSRTTETEVFYYSPAGRGTRFLPRDTQVTWTGLTLAFDVEVSMWYDPTFSYAPDGLVKEGKVVRLPAVHINLRD